MKRAAVFCVSIFLIAISAMLFSHSSFAQEVTPPGNLVRIKKIEPNSKVATPEYSLRSGVVASHTRNWFQVIVYYETARDWMDDLTFTYYIVTQNKAAAGQYTLFRGEVTYVNIQKGKHKSDIYLHPSTIARYGDVQRVAVVISSQGRVLALESLPASNQRWWELLTPKDGYVLNRMQTPFAMISFDDYEAIKPSTAK